jgi:hypothetical protein
MRLARDHPIGGAVLLACAPDVALPCRTLRDLGPLPAA